MIDQIYIHRAIYYPWSLSMTREDFRAPILFSAYLFIVVGLYLERFLENRILLIEGVIDAT